MNSNLIILILIKLLLIIPNSNGLSNIEKSDDPVEITADDLTIDQEKHVAIFSGHVVAIQGKVQINADKMIAHYAENDKEKQKGTIKKIVTLGHVVINNGAQIAKGDEGVYKVYDEIIELNGQVILTENKNILKGDKLIYNLKTGKSQVFSNDKNINSRVKAIFTPKAQKNNVNEKLTPSNK